MAIASLRPNGASDGTSSAGPAPPAPEPVAIIGMACRFPGGAHTPDALWRLLREKGDAVVEVPPDRWSTEFHDPDHTRPGRMVTKHGGFVRQPIDGLDAPFFRISPREAAGIDPMQRWLMEVSWEALEDAGQDVQRLAGAPVGVFIGVFTHDMKILRLSEDNRHLIDAHTAGGVGMTMASNRLSYLFDFRGPSVSLDTACSSSLVAVHLACQSLWSGESELALAGGANAILHPGIMVAESRAGMLSPDGRSKSFDARANGYGRGEGAGVVILKRLSRALTDGDPVRALVLGTAANQDGHTEGITVPNGDAQEALLRAAARQAGISPGRIRYMEAHGTGTPVGDPIEAKALAAVLAEGRPAGDRCIVGSVKANIGHLEAAAGVAGLMKAVLCLEHREIPPQLHFETPNPAIPFDDLCLRIPTTLEPWPDEPGPTLAGVNSFGFGGTNAHAVLASAPDSAEAPAPAPVAEPGATSPGGEDDERAQLIPLSASSPEALAERARQWRRWLEDGGAKVELRDLAYTAAARRTHLPYRVGLVAASAAELAGALDDFGGNGAAEPSPAGHTAPAWEPRVAWVFSGMGPQWWGMGRELLAQEPVFRRAIERCAALLSEHAEWSLLEEMSRDEQSSRMGETQISQPANFAVQVGLAALLRSWGMEPAAIVGHSTGEVAAAYVSGAMSLETAVRVIHRRSLLQHRTTGMGTLLAVGLPRAEMEPRLAGLADVSVAAVNAPSSVTLSGEPAVLEPLARELEEEGVFCRFLRVNVPFHSHYMDPLRPELLRELDGLELRPTDLPLYSTVTGRRIEGTELGAPYWWRNVRDPVLFSDATRALAADGLDVFLEIGPHPVLSSAMAESLRASASGDGSDGEGGSGGDPPPRVLSTLRRTTPELRTLLGTLGALYAAGVRPHWAALHPTRGRVVALPPYPWQRESYWEESLGSRSIRLGGESHPLLGRRLEVAEPGWQSRLRSRDAAYLPDHRIDGLVVFPGAAYVEMGLAAARLHLGAERSIEIEGVEFEKALFLSDDVPTALQTLLDPESLGFQVFGRTGEQDDRWTRHARGRLVPLPASAGAGAGVDGATQIDLDALRAGSRRELSSGECYRRLHELGYHFGPTFQNIARAWQGEGEGEGDCLAHIRAHQRVEAAAGAYHVHPSMLDAAFQTLIVSAMDSMKATYLPVRIDRMVFHAGRAGTELWVHARLGEVSESRVEGSLEAYDAAGRLVFAIEGVHARSVEAGQGAGGGSLARLLYDLEWEPVELRAPEADALPGLHVIFADPGGVGDAAALRLRQEGQRCVLVRPRSGAPMEIKGDVVHLDPGSAEDFTRLFREVADPSGARPLLTVLHLWNLDGPAATDGRGGANGRPARGHEGLDTAGLRGAQITGSESLLHVVRSLTEVGEAPRLWVVTCGAVATGPSDPPVAVAQAPAWGLTRAILHQEYTELAGGLVDLDAAPETGAKLAGALLDAIGGAPPGEDQLAIRHGDCLAVRAARSRTGAEDAPRPRLRPDATYLITGGFGGLGPLAARWMVERGARRLILMGRTPLPGRRLWSQVEPGTREAGMVAVVREIEALGASVHAAAVDVSDEVALGAWLEDFQQQGLPSIRGVLHAAGVATPELVEQLSTEEFRAGMAPKVAGAWNLHRALEDSPLDFFVLFSSIAGLGASLGTSSYAAGNAFMDALAHHRRALGRPATSIVWGAFGEVGMVVYLESEHGMLSRGVGLMPASTVRDGLDAALAADLTQPVIASLDWSLIDRANYPVGAPAMFRALVESASEAEAATDGGREGRGASILAELQGAKGAAARREVLERFLVDLTARMLGLRPERLESTRPLVDLGLDSMIAVDLKNRVDAALGVSPPLVELFRNATVSSIADNLLARLSSSTGAPPPSENPAGSQREAPAETSARPTTGAVRTESAAGLPDAGVPPVPPGPAGPPDALGTA